MQMQLSRLGSAQLGGTGLEISRVGFGAWELGGGGREFGAGAQQDQESIETIHRALELGVNWIDTAASHDFGHSEELVGRALTGVDQPPYVFTKGSLMPGSGGRLLRGRQRDSILGQAEASLRRLGVDAIDLYQIQWPNPDAGIEEGWSAVAELRERGLVRHIGVANFDLDQLRRIQAIAPVETLQSPYSLFARDAEAGILPFARNQGIGVIVYSPMGSGLLAGRTTWERIVSPPRDDWSARDARVMELRLSRHLDLAERLRTVAARHDTTPGAVAAAWTLRNPAVHGAIVGFRRPDQVEEVLDAARLELSDQDAANIEAAGRPGERR